MRVVQPYGTAGSLGPLSQHWVVGSVYGHLVSDVHCLYATIG